MVRATSHLVTDAVVVRRVQYGEADLIVTLYTRELGKISALARSARRSRKRFGGGLELFTVSEAVLKKTRANQDLWTLSSANPKTCFLQISTDMTAMAHASYCTEVVRELCAIEQPDAAIFELIEQYYHAVNTYGAHVRQLRVFELHLLSLIGLAPVIESCMQCGGGLKPPFRFALAHSGMVCSACVDSGGRWTDSSLRALSPETYAALLGAWQADSLDSLHEASWQPCSKARDLIVDSIQQHVGKALRSLDFIAKIRSAP